MDDIHIKPDTLKAQDELAAQHGNPVADNGEAVS